MTTTELKQLEVWPQIQSVLDDSIRHAKTMFPCDKIELVEKGTCFHIEVNGTPVIEIDGESLIGKSTRDKKKRR